VLGGRIAGIGAEMIGGVPYVTFSGDLDEDRDAAFLAHLSAIYALYQVRDGLLRPFDIPSPGRFDDDLVTIQKYQGKTNEQFTRLLLNVTLLSSAFAPGLPDRQFAVLDPLCGRGTTLNQALRLGFDAAGVEHDRKDFEAYATFIKTWLKRKKIKHHADYDGPVGATGRSSAAVSSCGWPPARMTTRPGGPSCSTWSAPTPPGPRSSSGAARSTRW
jgi:hypothetical protein